MGIIENRLDIQRAALSDFILIHNFKMIRYECKYMGRSDETLLKYINELEYRGLKYRL